MVATIQIVLSSFNRPKMVVKAVKSILAQTFSDWKLYIMDNSSPQMCETMRNIYEAYALRDQRITVDYTLVENRERWSKPWVSVVANKAVFNISAGEPFVTFMADDNYMMPQKLATLHSYLVKHPLEMCVAGKMEIFDRQGKTVTTLGGIDFKQASCHVDWVQPLYRREILNKVGPLLESLGGNPDSRLFKNIAAQGAVMRGLNIVLDKMPIFTKRTYFTPTLYAKAQRGECMDP